MGLVKNDRGQIVRDKAVDLDKKAYFNYEYDGQQAQPSKKMIQSKDKYSMSTAYTEDDPYSEYDDAYPQSG